VASQPWSALPGADLVADGLEDLAHNRDTIAALVVAIGAPKLRSLGVVVPVRSSLLPEHALYARLQAENGRTAHSRYNALVGRLVSFERALACANA